MIGFPNAKINLGLSILNRRPEGYHDIESCFYPVGWCDALEVIPAGQFSFQSYGAAIPGSRDGNLCIRAYEMLKADYDLPPVAIHLLKNIPIGAGLGGGSADGAFALSMFNEVFGLAISIEKLEEYAAILGSDCPFFIRNQPVIAVGTGTSLTPVGLDLGDLFIIIVNPGIHISTAEAYAGVTPASPEHSVTSLMDRSRISEWKELLKNDFEDSVFLKYPILAEIKSQFYKAGAIYSSMTGSGSSMFGLFNKAVENPFSNYKSFGGFLGKS